jgi:hypothetical protein
LVEVEVEVDVDEQQPLIQSRVGVVVGAMLFLMFFSERHCQTNLLSPTGGKL